MTKQLKQLTALFLTALFCLGVQSQDNGTVDKVRTALDNNIRDDSDRNADSYRLPAETLAFFGLEDDMRVLELIPGGGYYTKILGQVLAERGQLYIAAGTDNVAAKLQEWGLDNVEVVDDNFEMSRGEKRGHNIISSVEFPVRNVDMALTFRNMHNIDPESRKKMNIEVFKALRSGGILGVIDHTRRHMEPWDEERWRRVDPVGLIRELQEIGFVFVDYSDLHYRPHDDLSVDTTDPGINRDSDRFTLKFIKP